MSVIVTELYVISQSMWGGIRKECNMRAFIAPFIGKIFGFLLFALSVVFIYLGINTNR